MGSTRKHILLPIFLLFVLAGCATTQQREETLRSKYPDWNNQEIQAVAARDVEPGMTTDMVREALGRQGDTKNGQGMGEEIWIYYKEITGGEGAYWKPCYWVYFKNGKVDRAVGEKVIYPW